MPPRSPLHYQPENGGAINEMSYRTAYTRQVSLACAPGRNRLDRVLQAGELLHRLKLRGDPFDTGPPVARLESNRLDHFEYIADVFLDVLDLDILFQIRKLALTLVGI